jgi:hypothetical protein
MQSSAIYGSKFVRHDDEWLPIIYIDHKPFSVLNLGASTTGIMSEITRLVGLRQPHAIAVVSTSYVSRFMPNADGSQVDPMDRPLPHEDPTAQEHLSIHGFGRGETQMLRALSRITRRVGEPPSLTKWNVEIVDAGGIYWDAIEAGWR